MWLRLREGDIAGEGDEEAEIHGAAGVRPLTGEAVEDASERGRRPLRLEDIECVIPGVRRVVGRAAVDDDRLPVPGGDLHLAAQKPTFCSSRGEWS